MNIGDVVDEHYRYKMPRPKIKVEGKGNGIKTLLVNMFDMAKALKVPPNYPTAYFGLRLGAQNKYDENTGRAIINGTLDTQKVYSTLLEFVNKFVLCPKCKLPETSIIAEKDENIFLKCSACGEYKQVDPREKLCTYISKNPPPKEGSMTQIVEKKQNQVTDNSPIFIEKDENIEWSTDVSEEAIKKRREEEGLSERIKNLTIALDSDEEVDVSPVEIMKEYINKRPNCTEMQLLKASLKIKKDYDLKDSDVACLLFESCFDDKNIMNNLKKRGKVLHRFIKTTVCQKTILGYLEALLGKEEELLEKKLLFFWNIFIGMKC